MAKYRLKSPHWLNDIMHAENAEIEWNGIPSRSMEPLDEEAFQAFEKRHGTRDPSSLGNPLDRLLALPDGGAAVQLHPQTIAMAHAMAKQMIDRMLPALGAQFRAALAKGELKGDAIEDGASGEPQFGLSEVAAMLPPGKRKEFYAKYGLDEDGKPPAPAAPKAGDDTTQGGGAP